MVGTPNTFSHDESLHQGFELLMDVGMSTVEVLREATVLATQCSCEDRGVIEVGE